MAAPVPDNVRNRAALAAVARLVEAPGTRDETTFLRGDNVWVAPEPASSDGDAPVDASVVTFIGGIGSVFFRWTEVSNADPVTYRLHVRAGEAPATDGTYEVASGVGLTFAAVRKLKDGTAVVGDGTVTYYGIVTVEDADGPGPASTAVSGVPAQVTSADIAVNAITANLLTANDAFIDALDATDFSAVTITGALYRSAASGLRLELVGQAQVGTLNMFSGHPDEVGAGAFFINRSNDVVFVSMKPPELDTNTGMLPSVTLVTNASSAETSAILTAEEIILNGPVDGIMRDGDVGTGTFRDSVDARVTAGITGKANTASPTFTGTVDATMGAGSVGTGTFRDSVDARVTALSLDQTETDARVTTVAPTVTMTTGSVGTGTFRDSVDARVTALSLDQTETDARVTAVAPTAVFAAAEWWHVASTGDATPTSTTNVTIPGMSQAITAVAGAVYRVDLDVDQQITTAGATNIVELLVDGVQTGSAVVLIAAANHRTNGHRTIFVTGLAAGTRTFTARTRSGAAATTTAVRVGSTLTIQRVK